MKKTLILGCMFIIALSCRAQVIPIEQKILYQKANGPTPKGSYLKDVNNLFVKFIGTWKTTYKSRIYTFIITKTVKTLDFLNISEDKLYLRYLVTELNGTIVEDTRGSVPYSNIFGEYFSDTADYYNLYYNGKNAKCGARGYVILRSITPTQISLFMVMEASVIPMEPCVGIDITKDVLYPMTETLTLTKQ